MAIVSPLFYLLKTILFYIFTVLLLLTNIIIIMNIKVIQHLLDNEQVFQKGAPKTFLFGGDEIQYIPVYFKDKAEFEKRTKDEMRGDKGKIIGFPTDIWKAKEIDSGYYWCITYTDQNDDFCYILCMNSFVYIMQGRQTIDSLENTYAINAEGYETYDIGMDEHGNILTEDHLLSSVRVVWEKSIYITGNRKGKEVELWQGNVFKKTVPMSEISIIKV